MADREPVPVDRRAELAAPADDAATTEAAGGHPPRAVPRDAGQAGRDQRCRPPGSNDAGALRAQPFRRLPAHREANEAVSAIHRRSRRRERHQDHAFVLRARLQSRAGLRRSRRVRRQKPATEARRGEQDPRRVLAGLIDRFIC